MWKGRRGDFRPTCTATEACRVGGRRGTGCGSIRARTLIATAFFGPQPTSCMLNCTMHHFTLLSTFLITSSKFLKSTTIFSNLIIFNHNWFWIGDHQNRINIKTKFFDIKYQIYENLFLFFLFLNRFSDQFTLTTCGTMLKNSKSRFRIQWMSSK